MTDDHINDTNDLRKRLAFEPKIKWASSFLYFTQGGVAQKLLYQLKYNGKKGVGDYLGKMYGEIIKDSCNVDFIVPVPIHKTKLKRRGYNQSFHFAEGIASALGLEVKPDLVIRKLKTESQTRKTKVARWKNVANVYSDISERLDGIKVMVVDDVITTGATVGMLCEKLSEAGVDSIYVVSIARGQ